MTKSSVYYYLLDKRSEIKFDLVTCLFLRMNWRQLNSKKSFSSRSNSSFEFENDKFCHKSWQSDPSKFNITRHLQKCLWTRQVKSYFWVSLLSKVPKWPRNWPFKIKNYFKIFGILFDFSSRNNASSIPRIWILYPEFTDRGFSVSSVLN